MPIRSLAAIAALALCAPASLLAQDPAQADPQEALATALTDDEFVAANFRQTMSVGFEGALRADPDMLEIENECPGLIGAMRAAVEPIMWPEHQRSYAEYRADLQTLFDAELSDEHARAAAQFFVSPLGQRFITTLTGQLTADAMLGELTGGETTQVSSEALAADNLESASRGLMALEPADRLEVTTILTTEPWSTEFQRLQPQIAALQLAMANGDFSAEEGAAMDAAMDLVIEEKFAACFPDEAE